MAATTDQGIMFGSAVGVPGTPQVMVTVMMPAVDFEAMRKLAGGDMTGAFAKAIALYRASAEAIQNGQHVGITDDADKLETEFVGL
jgi:hypothetical protein